MLHVRVGDYIALEYLDPAPQSRVTTQATLVLRSHVANLTMHPPYPAIGDEVAITMIDNDVDTSPNTPESARVIVRTNHGGNDALSRGRDHDDLYLQESAASSGVFTGLIKLAPLSQKSATASALPSPATVTKFVSPGDVVMATINDIEPLPTNRSASVFVATPVTVTLGTILAEGYIDVQVRDPDSVKAALARSTSEDSIYYESRPPMSVTADIRWQGPSAAEAAWRMSETYSCQDMEDEWRACTDDSDQNHFVVLANCPFTCAVARGEPVSDAARGGGSIRLTEKPGLPIGTFLATIYLSGPLAWIPGIDLVKPGMHIKVTYGSPQMLGRTVHAITEVQDSFSGYIRASAGMVEAGQAFHVEVYDIDLNAESSLVEEVTVVASVGASEQPTEQTVVLVETGPATSRFTAQIHTLPEGSSATAVMTKSVGVSELTAEAGHVVHLTYSDVAPQRNVSTRVVVTQAVYRSLSLTALGGSQVVEPSEREKERVIREGGSFEIRLIDPSSNISPAKLDYVQVQTAVSRMPVEDLAVDAGATHASDILLGESGPDTGIFVATVRTMGTSGDRRSSAPASLPGSAQVAIVAAAGDVVTVSYGTGPGNRRVSRTILPSVSGVSSLRGAGNASAIVYGPSLKLWPFEVGSLVSVSVVDADLNQDVAAAEEAVVSVAVSSNGQVAQVRIAEQGDDTSLFTGVLRTGMEGPEGAELQSLLQQGVLPIAPGSVLTAVYQDAAPERRVKSAMYARASMTGQLQLSPPLLKSGGVLTVYLKDSDLDADSNLAEIARVTVTCGANQDSEELQLRETSKTSGIFTAQLQTVQTVVNGVHDSGWLNVRFGASILASYRDDRAGGLVETSAATRMSTMGLVAASRRVAVGDSQLSVSITDHDLDVSTAPDFATAWLVPAEGWGVAGHTCPLFACDPGGAAALRLVETGAATGVFTGSFATSSVLSEPNEKQCVNQAVPTVCSIDSDCLGGGLCRSRHYWPGASSLLLVPGTVSVLYDDIRPDGHSTVSWPVVVVDGLSLLCSPPTFLAGTPVTITLQSITDDISAQPDLAIVRAHAYTKDNEAYGGDPVGIPVVLTETAGSSSLFTGVLPTADRATIADEDLGKLGIDVVAIETGEQIYIRTDNNTGRVVSFKLQAQTQATMAVSPSALRLGGFFGITIVDRDLRASGAEVDATVIVFEAIDPFNPPPGGVRPVISTTTISLSETLSHPGVFTGRALVTDDSLVPTESNAPKVLGGVNDLVVTKYQDHFPSQELSAQVEVLESVSGKVVTGSTLLAGAVLTVTVEDADQNVDSTIRDLVTVQVRAQRTNSHVAVTLLETDYNSGIFIGSLLSRPQAPSSLAIALESAVPGSVTQAAAEAGKPLLQVEVAAAGDTLAVSFEDSAPRQIVTTRVPVIASSLGSVMLSDERLAAGSFVTVTVTDPDALEDDVNLTISAPSIETPVLLTAKSAKGSAKTFLAQFGVRSDDQELESHSYEVEPYRLAGKPMQLPRLDDGEVITVSYLDHGPEAKVSTAIPVCSSAEVEIHPLVFGLDTHGFIRVRDLDMAQHSGSPLRADVTNLNSMQSTSIVLEEESPDGTFTGRVLVPRNVENSEASAAEGVLFADKGDTIRVSFEDSCPAHVASVQALVRNYGSISVSSIANGLSSTDVRSGGVLDIVVEDPDLNVLREDAEEVEVRCASGSSILEHVVLVEKGVHSSLFTGRLLTADIFNQSSAAAPSADSVTTYSGRAEEAMRRPQDYQYDRGVNLLLNTYAPPGHKRAYTAAAAIQAQDDFESVGADIVCEYLDIQPRARQTAMANIVASHRAVLETQPTRIVRAGGAIYVSVHDRDLTSGGPAAVATVHSQSDTLDIVLTENGVGSGVFTGKGLTSEDAAADSDASVLRVRRDYRGRYEVIQVRHQEEAPYILHTLDLQVDRSHRGRIVLHPHIVGLGSAVQIAVVDADLMMGQFNEAGAILTENIQECRSTGKDPCAFPFTYKGDTYDMCISRDNYLGDLWCATTPQYERSRWEYCECTCRGCDTSAAVIQLETSRGASFAINLTQAPGRSRTAEQALHEYDPTDPFSKPFPGGRVGGPVDTFTGQFFTRAPTGLSDSPGPGEILVMPGTLITLSYQDAAPEGNDTIVVEVMSAQAGTLSATPWPALPGTPISITLVDPDVYESQSSTVSEIMTVNIQVSGPSLDVDQVRNGVAGSLSLVDDGTGAGRFTGFILPLFSEAANERRQEWKPGSSMNASDGVITVRYDDWLQLTYEDHMPLQTILYDIKVANPGSIEASVLHVGGEMTVTVHDSDMDWSHDQIDSFDLIAYKTTNLFEQKRVAMLETRAHSGIFTGLLSINPSSLSDPFLANASYLPEVGLDDTIEVVYDEREPSLRRMVRRTVSSSTVGVLTNGAVRSNINKRDVISITVVDPDLNLSPLEIDTTLVVATLYTPESDSRGQHAERIILSETSLDSPGVFTGRLQTHAGSINAIGGNGVIDVVDGDHIVVRYRDAAPAATLATTIKVSTAGVVSMLPPLLDAGKEITVKVNDYDLNVDPHAVENGSASVRSASGDEEPVTLVETGPDTSIFTGAVPTSTNISAPDGILAGVVPDSMITATYVDAIVDVPLRMQSYTALARVASNGSLSLLPVLITQDLPVTITITDKDQNLDSDQFDIVPCQLVSLCSEETRSWDGSPLCSIDPANEVVLDIQNVTLNETSTSSGIFTAIVATHSENRSNVSKVYHEPSVRAPSGAIVRLQYVDKNPTPARLRMTERRVARAGLLYAASSFVNEFATLFITLEDADLDSSDGRDTNCAPAGMEGVDIGELLRNCPAPVRLIGPRNNGTREVQGYRDYGINVLLYETAFHSGVFIGEVSTTSYVSDVVQSGIVQAATQGSFITLTYGDAVPAALRTRVVKVASVAKITTDPTILPAENNLTVTVQDADLNADPSLEETSTVTITQRTITPYSVRELILRETSSDSDIFTGLLATSIGSADAGAGARLVDRRSLAGV